MGTNEAGMRLGDDSRGADAAIWRRAKGDTYDGGFQRMPPVLAVEVAGRDEGERRYGVGERLPADPRLPGLCPLTDEFFVQISQPPAS